MTAGCILLIQLARAAVFLCCPLIYHRRFTP